MHEGKFTQQIVETIIAELKKYPEKKPKKVTVCVGEVFHLDVDSVLMHYGYLSKDTDLQGVEIILKEIPVTVFCAPCQKEQPVEDHHFLVCPACSSSKIQVVKGKEIFIESIELQ